MRENRKIKILLISISLIFLVVMLIFPLLFVIGSALSQGVSAYLAAISSPAVLSALKLTVFTTLLTLLVNTVFGLSAVWLLFHYQFRGKSILATIIDLPFTISPVVVGLMLVLTFGKQGWLFPLLHVAGVQVLFAFPAIFLATIFVTLPFISREVLPTLEARGNEEEQAAAILGAGTWEIFRKITLPDIKYPLIYGIVLTSARALGEYGAVSVVSGNLIGKTVTLPLQINVFYDNYQVTAAFAVASLLVMIAVLILIARNIIEHKGDKNVRRT